MHQDPARSAGAAGRAAARSAGAAGLAERLVSSPCARLGVCGQPQAQTPVLPNALVLACRPASMFPVSPAKSQPPYRLPWPHQPGGNAPVAGTVIALGTVWYRRVGPSCLGKLAVASGSHPVLRPCRDGLAGGVGPDPALSPDRSPPGLRSWPRVHVWRESGRRSSAAGWAVRHSGALPSWRTPLPARRQRCRFLRTQTHRVDGGGRIALRAGWGSRQFCSTGASRTRGH